MFEFAARNERWVVLGALALAAAVGLGLTLHLGDILMMPLEATGGRVAYAVILFAMWWTMMLAMMLPSAAPAILAFAAINRKFSATGIPPGALFPFVAGYAAIWTGFAAAAVVLQLMVAGEVALSAMMAVTSSMLGGGLLMAAGLYQMSPFKQACLRKCQMPLMYFAHHWRRGYQGAFRMGAEHGAYCLGCCWVLMGLLFYGGVMEPRWIVGLAVYVAVEKLVPASTWLSRYTGVLLIAWGAWTIVSALG